MLAAAGDVPTQEIMAASDKLKELGVKFKVVNVADLLSLQSAKENDEALSDEEFADIFTADKPVLFAYHSYAHDVRGLIYDRPNHDNFNVHPDYTDWVYSGVNTDKKGAVTATAATAGDNE